LETSGKRRNDVVELVDRKGKRGGKREIRKSRRAKAKALWVRKGVMRQCWRAGFVGGRVSLRAKSHDTSSVSKEEGALLPFDECPAFFPL